METGEYPLYHPTHTVVYFFKCIMKDLSYYQATSVSIPRKDDYLTTYYYRKGVMVGMKRQFDEDFIAPKNCVEEHVLDEISFAAHMKLYQEENLRLQEEFRVDLIDKYNMTGHPKANKLFDKAWDIGCSCGYNSVELYFRDLLELFEDEPHDPDYNISDIIFGNDQLIFT